MFVDRCSIETSEDWDGLIDKIPYIQFPADWEVSIIPPFMGAMVRFLVRRNDKPDNNVSVYMDSMNRLGHYGEDDQGNPIPYWEIYPYGEDTGRCDLNDIPRLLEMIAETLYKD